MITREEYETAIQNGNVAECIIASGAYINSLQQHIKSLEAQLANTEQLTCVGCKWEYHTEAGNFICKSFEKQNCFRDERLNDRYTAKDTQ